MNRWIDRNIDNQKLIFQPATHRKTKPKKGTEGQGNSWTELGNTGKYWQSEEPKKGNLSSK